MHNDLKVASFILTASSYGIIQQTVTVTPVYRIIPRVIHAVSYFLNLHGKYEQFKDVCSLVGYNPIDESIGMLSRFVEVLADILQVRQICFIDNLLYICFAKLC